MLSLRRCALSSRNGCPKPAVAFLDCVRSPRRKNARFLALASVVPTGFGLRLGRDHSPEYDEITPTA